MDTSMVDNSNLDDARSSSESSQEFTFGTASTLRRNLIQTFDQQLLPPKNDEQREDEVQDQLPVPNATMSERILLYEAATMGDGIKPPHMPTRTLQPNNSVPSDRFAVYLRIRPPASYKSSGGQTNNRKRKMILESNLENNTIEILPPKDPTQNPTTVRTYPPPDSNAIKIKSTQIIGQIPTSSACLVREFQFHQVLSPDTSQQDFYSVVAAPLIQNLFSESKEQAGSSQPGHFFSQKSALLFSYGITNAGKTHTMLGTTTTASDTTNWGVIPRAISDILNRIKLAKIEQGEVSDLFVSCFEVYNEQIFDLLPRKMPDSTVGPPPVLKVREAHGQILVRGLAKHKISTVTEGLELTRTANGRRHTSSNNLNTGSSRSHFICQLQVIPSNENRGTDIITPIETSASGFTTDEEAASTKSRNKATVWLVDLAGSERAKRTGLGSSRQKEASQINKSLLTLMRCLTAMREKNSGCSLNVIPFRESKLTHLFMHHLTGFSSHHTSMVVNVNPSIADFDETQHVLAYASKAKTIHLKPSEVKDKYKTFGVEYDVNGRKKAKTVSMGKNILSKVVKNLSPNGIVSRLSPRKQGQQVQLGNQASQTLSDEHLQTILATKNETIKSLKEALTSASSEIEELQAENGRLIEELQQQERQIRIEVSEEIEERFKATRARNLQELERLKSKLTSDPSLCRSTQKAQKDKADTRIEELMDQVTECEEEMTRLRQEHAAEKIHFKSRIRVLEAMKKTVRFDDQTMDRLTVLERELDSSRKEIEALKKSKKELIENYEKLLNDDEDDDSERTVGSNSNRENYDFEKGPLLGVKATSRPPLQVINRTNYKQIVHQKT